MKRNTRKMMSFWRRHRSTALRYLLLVALLHRLQFLPFLAASSPVWLLTAFLLGAVLVHSEQHNGAAESEEDRRHLAAAGNSSSSASSSDVQSSSVTSSMDDPEEHHHHLVGGGDMAWTVDDEHSIRSIGSLELERDARLEKLMSRRSIYRNLIDLDVHIPPAVLAPRTKNPFDHHHDTGSAPSSLLGAAHRTNPFFDIHPHDHDDGKAAAMLLRRHETFTASGSNDAPPARTSRFRPYFVADVQEGAPTATGTDNSSSSSSSPSSSAASDHHQTQQQHAVVLGVEESARTSTPGKWDGNGNGMLGAVDVELISDSSDDDMSLPGDDAAATAAVSLHSNSNPPDEQLDEDEEDSFEVESITQQVAAVKQQPRVTAVQPVSSPSGRQQQQQPTTVAPVEENEKTERELSEIRQHHILGPVPIINSSTATSSGAGVGDARAVVAPSLAPAAPAPTPPAAASASAPPAAAPAPPAAASAPAAPAPPAAASAPPVAAPAPAPPAAASAPPAATSRKPSSKSKATSKKPVFGFFRK